MTVIQDLTYETEFWGNCCNTFSEERKHFVYARLMGLTPWADRILIPDGLKILDMGGGPVSMLLKTHREVQGVVWDPIVYPSWVKDRYAAKNIELVTANGEDLNREGFDEVWIYNCLQHTIDPEKIVQKCMKAAKVIRMFEWIDLEPHLGHPHKLTEVELNAWTGKKGHVTTFNGEEGCYGKAYCLFQFTGN
jgi:hypothetical protein